MEGSLDSGYRDKRGTVPPDTSRDLTGVCPSELSIQIKKAAKDSPPLLVIKIIEQAYWMRNFPNVTI